MKRKLKSFILVILTVFLLIAVSIFPIQTGVETSNSTVILTGK